MAHLRELIRKGARGTLKSTIPPITGPAWVSFALGKNPGKHGCFDFTFPNSTLDSLKTISTEHIHGTTFYELLVNDGKKCILINLPVSYPPRTEEITITSLLTKGDQFVFPESLKDEILQLENYKLAPDMRLLRSGKVDAYLDDIRKLERTRFEVAKELFHRDWDFFFVLFSGSDWIQHVVFDELVTGKWEQHPNALQYYEELDNYIYWFAQQMGEKDNLILVSDHGFDVYDGKFFINEWLHQQGYLQVKDEENQTDKHQIEQDWDNADKNVVTKFRVPLFIRRIIQKISLVNRVVSPLYRWLRDRLNIEIKAKISVDAEKTQACSTSHDMNGIFINTARRFINGIVTESQYEHLRQELIDKLKRLKTADGTPVFKNVWAREDVYHGEKLNEAPDIVLETDRLLIKASFPIKIFDPERENGHHPNGIFLGVGADFLSNAEIETAQLTDIAPTVLYLMRQPVPESMDGSVLVSALKKGMLEKYPITFSRETEKQTELKSGTKESQTKDDRVIERLKGLGYIE